MPKLPTITIFGTEYRVPLLTLDAMPEYDKQRAKLGEVSGAGEVAKALLRLLRVQMDADDLPFLTDEEIEAAPKRLSPGDLQALDQFTMMWMKESFGPGEAIATSVLTGTGNGSSPNLRITDSAAAIPNGLAA